VPLTDDVVIRRKTSVREASTKARQQTILDAAVEAFAEHGYNATSLRDVAARANISHTGLLHHFPDKPGLLEAALDRLVTSTADQFGFESDDGAEVIRALVAAAERDVKNPTTLRFLCQLTAEALTPGHPAHGYTRDLHRLVKQRLTFAFTDLQQRELYRAEVSPAVAALQAMALRDGAIIDWLLTPEEIDLVEILRSHLRMFVDLDL